MSCCSEIIDGYKIMEWEQDEPPDLESVDPRDNAGAIILELQILLIDYMYFDFSEGHRATIL